MNILRFALACALFSLPVQAETPEWSVDAQTGIAHHNPSRGFCPTLFGGLPRTSQSDTKSRGGTAVCAYGPPSQPNAQLITIQEMPDVPRAELDENFRRSFASRFPGSKAVPEIEAACQNALTKKMGSSEARCMAIQRDGFTAFLGFHVIKGWSFQPMFVTSGKGLTEKNIQMIGTTFGELYKIEAEFMQLVVR